MYAVLLAVLSPAFAAQAPDSTPPVFPDPDRVVIDAAAIVRDGGVQSLADLLNSRVPGLLVVSGDGLNGGGSRIRFAGPRRLLSDGAPLILLDGMRVDATADASPVYLGGPGPLRIEDFNVEDIESIEVISNPAAAMIYGAGAADGVIVIHTKRGRSGALQLDGYAFGRLASVSTEWPRNYGGVDADQTNPILRNQCSLQLQAVGACVQDFVQSFSPLVERSPFSATVRHHAGFSATGGPRWGAFRLAGGLEGDGGVYDVPVNRNPDGYRRWNVTSSGTVQLHPRIAVGFKVTHVSSNLQLPLYGPISSALLGPPNDSAFSWVPLFGSHPRERLSRTSGIVEAEGQVLNWLSARAMLGLDEVDQGDTVVTPGASRTETLREIRNTTEGWSLSAVGPSLAAFTFRTTLGWDRAVRKREEEQSSGPDTEPFCADVCQSLSFQLPRRSVGAYIVEEIGIRDRLTLAAALRYDKFVPSDQHRTNPMLRVSWVARRHAPGLVSGLRLHASYGSASGPGFPDVLSFVFLPEPVDLPAARPERVTSVQLGGDAQLLDGRWSAVARMYDLRSEALDATLIQTPFGLIPTFASGAKVENRGITASVGGPLLARDNVRWDVQLSLWGNRNRLRALAGPERLFGNAQGLIVGYPVGGYWGNRVLSYADANGDGIIAYTEVVVEIEPSWAGTPYPTQGAALHSSLALGRRLRLTTTLDYRAGHVLFNLAAWSRCQYAFVCRDVNDPATPLARQAVAVASPARGIPLQYFEDADYLKLRELQLSVDLPSKTAGLIGAGEATLSLAARNLFTWTRYSGGDPEAGSYGFATPGSAMAIEDMGATPVLRSLALQVRASY